MKFNISSIIKIMTPSNPRTLDEGQAIAGNQTMNQSSLMRAADALNTECLCRTVDPRDLRHALEQDSTLAGLAQSLAMSHPHLFSQTAVFLDTGVRTTLEQSIAALERVFALPAYQAHTLAQADPIARLDWGPAGVFMGYDFHLGANGPRLIEINTNAGGALLNAALARAQRACCTSMAQHMDSTTRTLQLDTLFVAMFQQEWQSQRSTQRLRTVAIVDDTPDQQYLAPEFALARQLMLRHGLHAVIADPQELQWRDGALWHAALPDNLPVDLVYNRLTDFALTDPHHTALRAAYEAGTVVLTPHPRAHALHANKRNLVTLSDDALLASWAVSDADRALIRSVVPTTRCLTSNNADTLWAQRRQLFFKPAAGYGAKAAYRGDKLTQRVWQQIVASGDFIAQDLVPPSERLVEVDGAPKRLKLDLRAYTYRGNVQLLAARTYSGQTTNMRTPGGGFCPVITLPQRMAATAISA